MAQLFSLGCYDFMKNTLIILLSGICLCGCSKRASDLLVAGKDIKWTDNYGHTAVTNVVHITKRDGSSIEGIRLVMTDGTGAITTITADRGSLDTNIVDAPLGGIDYTNVVGVTLEDAQLQDAKTNQTIKSYSFFFRP